MSPPPEKSHRPDGETRLPGPHADPVPLMLNAKLLVESLYQVTPADALAAAQANTTLEPRRNRRRFFIYQTERTPLRRLDYFLVAGKLKMSGDTRWVQTRRGEEQHDVITLATHGSLFPYHNTATSPPQARVYSNTHKHPRQESAQHYKRDQKACRPIHLLRSGYNGRRHATVL